MSTNLIKTKLNIPSLQHHHFTREDLLKRISRERNSNIIVVNAPAGYGKTTLICDWIQNNSIRNAWYSLSKNDNNIIVFLTYFIAALQDIGENLGLQVLKDLEMLESLGPENILISLINELEEYGDDCTIVIDDFHLIQDKEIIRSVSFLLEYIPKNVTFIIISRNCDSIPVSRLRAKNKLYEVTVDDLMFDGNELSKLIESYISKKLTTDEIEIIQEKTEGWITSIHLFALALMKQKNYTDFIETFSGNHVFIFDYLLSEVFNQQDKKIQEFLMITSLFDRFSLNLTSQLLDLSIRDTQEYLEYVNQFNLFIINLDNEREWYRYHNLFQDFLKKVFYEQEGSSSLRIKSYKVASRWFNQKGFTKEAVQYALNAQDYQYVLDIVEQQWYIMDQNLESAVWLEWIMEIPEELYQNRPILLIGYAWALLDNGISKGVEDKIERARVLVEEYHNGYSNIIVSDESTFLLINSIIYSAKAYIETIKGNRKDAYRFVMKAKSQKRMGIVYEKRVVYSLFGLAQWSMGYLEEAYRSLNYKIDTPKLKIKVSSALCCIRIEQGRLIEAESQIEETINLIHTEVGVCDSVEASMYLLLSRIALIRGDILKAEEFLITSKKLGDKNSIRTWKYDYYKQQSACYRFKYQYHDALRSLDKANRYKIKDPIPEPYNIKDIKMDIYMAQEKCKDATEYVQLHSDLTDVRYRYLEQYEYKILIKAYLLLRKYNSSFDLNTLEEIISSLSRRLKKQNQLYHMTEILLLEVVLHSYKQEHQKAIDKLQVAFDLSVFENYQAPFIEFKQVLLPYLEDPSVIWNQPEFVKDISSSVIKAVKREKAILSPTGLELVVPLSNREKEILILISQGKTNIQISKKLFLAVSTVKNYNQNLFCKLQVKNRTEALKKANDLGIL